MRGWGATTAPPLNVGASDSIDTGDLGVSKQLIEEGWNKPATPQPRFSILMAAYNAREHIAEAISSALSQTTSDLELIVIDDCSSDETPDIVGSFAESDPRVRLLRLSRNGGPGHARNAGLRAARGDWIVILDADDHIHTERLARLGDIGDAQAADLVADNLWLCEAESGQPFEPMFTPDLLSRPHFVGLEEFIRKNSPKNVKRKFGLLKPLIRRDFLVKNDLVYDEDAYLGEDFLLYVHCLIKKAKFYIIDTAYYYYRISSGSITRARSLSHVRAFIALNENLLCLPELRNDPRLVRAVEERVRQLKHDYVYVTFVSALKRGRMLKALGVLAGELRSLTYVIGHLFAVLSLRLREKSLPRGA